jgi:hypothetical protein
MANKDYSARPIWLLCEGNDCYHFFMRVLEKLEILNVYCFDVGGIKDKSLFSDVNKRTNYSNTKVIVYVRDAEYAEGVSGDTATAPTIGVDDKSVLESVPSPQAANGTQVTMNNTAIAQPVSENGECESVGNVDVLHYNSVIQSIKSRFDSINLLVGDKPLELTANEDKKAGYIVLTNDNGNVGTLEDLLLTIAVDKDAVDDAVLAINCVNSKRNEKVRKHIHKRKLHIAFALNENDKMVGAKTGEAVICGGLDLDHAKFKAIRDFLCKLTKLEA